MTALAMKFLPFESITYKTHRDAFEVRQKLAFFIADHPGQTYEGQMDGADFYMRRLIGYRNSFLPQISGTIYRTDEGTTIKVKMNIHGGIIVLLLPWFVGIIAAIVMLLKQPDDFLALPIPLGMLLFAYGLIMIPFKKESRLTKEDLKHFFESGQ